MWLSASVRSWKSIEPDQGVRLRTRASALHGFCGEYLTRYAGVPPRAGRLAFLALSAAALLHAHVISMSNGYASVRGDHLDYVLNVPLYEAAHTPHPDRDLLDHIRFSSRGETARMVQKSCHEDSAQAMYVCAAEYMFSRPIDRLDVNCTLYQVTVPNHVHMLRAENGGKHDQAIFDYTFTDAMLRFRPPTALEVAVQQGFEGILRGVAGPLQLLFLVALVFAGRSGKELSLMAVTFLLVEFGVAILAGHWNWQPPVRFVEAAMALSIAYLAVEVLFLPQGGMRWLIAGILGGFFGLSLYLVLAASDFWAGYFLGGVALAQTALVGLFSLALVLFRRRWPLTRLVQVCEGLLLLTGMAWFFLRLRS